MERTAWLRISNLSTPQWFLFTALLSNIPSETSYFLFLDFKAALFSTAFDPHPIPKYICLYLD